MLIDRLFSNKFMLRDVEAEELLESFLVSAIAAVLGTRFLLNITGYPQLGGDALHFAHVLFGGAFMLLSIITLLVFVSKPAVRLAAVLGGGGFGLFIDEIGKFVTHDNNYFFEPSIAIIYLVFVLIYLFSQGINKRKMSQREYLINSIHIAHEAVYNDLDGFEKKKALRLLNECDKRDPMAKVVRGFIRRLEQVEPRKPGVISRLENIARKNYQALVAKRWFSRAIITFFIVQAITSLWHATEAIKGMRLLAAALLAALFSAFRLIGPNSGKNRIAYALVLIAAIALMWNAAESLQNPQLSAIDMGELVSSAISGALVISGLIQIRKSRVGAYKKFKVAVLISIFLTQFFAFYKEQLSALLGLGWNILILITLRYMINEEWKLRRK